MELANTGLELAKLTGVDERVLRQTFDEYVCDLQLSCRQQ
jgi:hypothetical protein